MILFFLIGMNSKYKLSDLYEIRQGVPLIKNVLTEEHEAAHYKVINHSSIANSLKILSKENLNEYSLVQDPRKEKSLRSKLLSSEDYLITCKGTTVKGFSLYYCKDLINGIENDGYHQGVIASANFIVLTPHPWVSKIFGYSYYLPNMLDLLVSAISNQIEANNNANKFITINDISNWTLDLTTENIGSELEKFSGFYSPYEKNLLELNEKMINLENYNIELKKRFNFKSE